MKMTAYFKDDSFYPQIKRKYFTTIDWFSFVGGFLGLFFGFSFLSGFEIIFHILSGIFRRKSVGDQSTNVVLNEESNRVRKFEKIQQYFRIFLKNSTIHGFVYVSSHKLKIYEK